MFFVAGTIIASRCGLRLLFCPFRALSLSNNLLYSAVGPVMANFPPSIFSVNCFPGASYAPQNSQCDIPASERQALVDLYSATNGAHWTSSSIWPVASGDPCYDGWLGVGCTFGAPSHVTYVPCS